MSWEWGPMLGLLFLQEEEKRSEWRHCKQRSGGLLGTELTGTLIDHRQFGGSQILFSKIPFQWKLLELAYTFCFIIPNNMSSEGSLLWFSWHPAHFSWKHSPIWARIRCSETTPTCLSGASFSENSNSNQPTFTEYPQPEQGIATQRWVGPCPGETGHPGSHRRQVGARDGG